MPEVLYAGGLEIRIDQGLVLATGQPLVLSVREFEVLVAMARRRGAIITRDELYKAVWGGQLRPGDRSVDVYVSKLRSKLEARCPIAGSSTPIPASDTDFSRSLHEMFTPRLPAVDETGFG